MLNPHLKRRLTSARAVETVALRIPSTVIESAREIAAMRGFSSYRALLRSYLSEGLRRDEAKSLDDAR
jgi:hypothetical protein